MMRPTGYLLAAVAACAAVLIAPSPARADEESQQLAAYRERIDASIERGLKYLVTQQLPNGSFKGPMAGSTAVASLSVMAFLSKGYTPEVGPYHETIDKAVDYVSASQQVNGLLVGDAASAPMYSHCISTLMLSEVSGMISTQRQERVDLALGKALKLILAAQKIKKPPAHLGGWRYQANSADSDMSVTGWALMALRSARNAGAAIPASAIEGALRFVVNCRAADGGFGYAGPASGLATTGTALLCLELCGMHGHAMTLDAGKYILKHPIQGFGGIGHFYYAMYYCSQAMFQLGGPAWVSFARNMYEIMLNAQQDDGAWPTNAGNAASAGPSYSTSMAILAMSVSCRQLPIYQR